jgi:hypothetical protein
MTDEQALAFLIEGAPTGKLATAAADGSRIHGRRNAVPGELLVRLRIDRIRGRSGVAD